MVLLDLYEGMMSYDVIPLLGTLAPSKLSRSHKARVSSNCVVNSQKPFFGIILKQPAAFLPDDPTPQIWCAFGPCLVDLAL